MQNTISRMMAIELISEIRDIVEKNIKLSKYIDGAFSEDDEERIEVVTNVQGVSNGFLSEILCTVTGYNFEVCGEVEKLFPCPCCGFRKLTEPYDPIKGIGYEICPYCNWEDDGTVDIKAYRSVNKGSIEDYRSNMEARLNRFYINKWFE